MNFVQENDSIPDFVAISKMKIALIDHDYENFGECSRNHFNNFSKYIQENKTPKILIMSLEAMYKTIQDTYETNPVVCCKFLQTILTYLESLQPGDWVSECDDIIDYLFKLLLGIVQTIDMQTSRVINRSRSMTNSITNSGKSISMTTNYFDDCLQSFDCHISIQKKLFNIATACLFSIGIAKGNISMLLVAINTVLIRNGLVDDNDSIQAPSLVLKFNYMSNLVCNDHDRPSCQQFSLINPLSDNITSGSLVSNGTYLFWLTSIGLLKIGTGFNGSIKGFVYLRNEELAKHWTAWIGKVSNTILLHLPGTVCTWKLGESLKFSKINIDNLQIDGQLILKINNIAGCSNTIGWKYYLFANSFRLGCCLINEVENTSEKLYIKMFKLTSDKFIVEECEKSIDMTHHLISRIEVEQSKIFASPPLLIETSNLSLACEALNLEEFCIVRNQSGEIFYKDIDNTERNNNMENWTRLYYNDYISAKFTKLIGGIDNKFICAISDEGLWRISINKHSQPRTLTLDRLMSNSRFVSKTWISGSCSKDNLALVSKEGQVLFLEKDSIHSLSTCYGALLSPYHVTQISLGKSHGACLSRNGYLITFGVNNYFQCGYVTGEHAAKYNDMINEMDNNNIDNCSQAKSKHQVTTIKPQKLLIYSENNGPTDIKSRSNFLRIQQVSCGHYHTVLLTTNGDVYSFGNNKYNQLGRGYFSTKELPKLISIQTNAVRITTGPFTSGILTQNGKVIIYGFKLITPHIIDVASNSTDPNYNLQPIFFNLSTNVFKKQIIFCIFKQNLFYLKKKSLNLSNGKSSNQHDQCKFLAKDNSILLTSDDQRHLLIDISSGMSRLMPDLEINEFNYAVNTCFDPRYSVVWSIDQMSDTKTVIIKYSKINLFKTDNLCLKIDPLIDLSEDSNFPSQRYRIALNVLVSAERLLMKKCTDTESNSNTKMKQLNKNIFSVKRFTKENSNWLYSPNAHDSIKFSVSESIYLHGIGLYSGVGENTVNLKIYEEIGHDSDTEEILNTNILNYDNQFSTLLLLAETEKLEIQSNENKKIIQVMLPSPIVLFSNKFYVIVATITGDSTDFGFHGRSKIDTDLGITFKFKQSKNSSNGTHVKEGQIPEIYYSTKMPEIYKKNCNPQAAVSLIHATSIMDYLTYQISMNSLTSAVALLNWIYTGLTCLFSELPDLYSNSNSQIYSYKLLKSLETLKLYSRAFESTLKIIRKHIQYLYPFNGLSKDFEIQETSVVIGDFRIIIRNIVLDCKICHYLQQIKSTFGSESIIFTECWKIFTENLIPVYKETFENSFYALYPEIEDQRFTLQEALTKVYEFCFNKSSDTLCNYGKIIFLSSLLKAVNSINDGSLLFIQKETSIYGSGIENKIGLIHNFGDRFPLLREYLRTIWKSNNQCSSDILSSTSSMIYCLLAIMTLDIKKNYKPCRQSNPLGVVSNDNEERKLFYEEMTCLINATHLILTNITHLMVDHITLSTKIPSFHMSQVISTNSKTNEQNNNQQYLDEIILTTQSRFKRVIWLDKINENSGLKSVEHIPNNTEHEIEDAVCFNISKDTNQFIDGYEIVGDNVIYLEGVKVYCSSFIESRCSAYIYRTKNPPQGIQENWQLVPMEYEWKNEEHDLIASDLIFKRKLKLEEMYRYAIKIFLTTSNNKKILVGQQPVTKLDARFGYRFNLHETKLRTSANQSLDQGIIFSFLYSFSTRPYSAIDNQRLERKIVKMCLIELLAQVKHALVSMVKETIPNDSLCVGQRIFIDVFLPLFFQKLQAVSTVSKKITCLSITLVREALPVIQEFWKANDKVDSQEKDFFTIIESSHPYESAKLIQNTIKFPDPVQAISISFDQHCITSQPEDYLTIKARTNKCDTDQSETKWKIIFKSLSNISSEWPKKAIIIPGNEVHIEFHTASLYEETLETTYGFKCTIVGHCSNHNTSVELIENSLTYLASKCATILLDFRKKSKIVKLLHDTNILQKSDIYQSILDQGLCLSKLPTLTDCLNKVQLEYVNSIQTNFIKKFVEGSNYCNEITCSPATHLAKWLQSCSVVVVSNCRLKFAPFSLSSKNQSDIIKDNFESNIIGNNVLCYLNKEVSFQLELIDQYENRVSSHMCNIEILLNYNHKGNNPFLNINETLFGGHPVPNTTVQFEDIIVGKDVYKSISMMKNYEVYSFEEIRVAGYQKNVTKSQYLKYRWSEEDGCFNIDWLPKICGQFNLIISIDKIILKSAKTSENITLKIDVQKRIANEVISVEKIRKKSEFIKDKMEKPKYLWFEGKQSAGLRLRSQPSFNSPVLGIIPYNTVLRYEEELFTETSVWIRLHFDSFHQWYGFYPTDPLDQRPVISVEPLYSNHETLQSRKKSLTLKPQIKTTAFCKKTVKPNLKLFTEGWCLKEHLNKVFLAPAKLNYNSEINPKENITKVSPEINSQINNGFLHVCSKTLPLKRRLSSKSNKNESKYPNNAIAVSLPNSPELALKRKTQNKLIVSSSASSSQPTSPGAVRRRSAKTTAQKTNVLNALSPLQAQTQRAIFVAIIWQNGIVSDLIQVAESLNLYSAYQQLEKKLNNNSTSTGDQKNNPPLSETVSTLSAAVTRSNSQNTGDMSLHSDSGGTRAFFIYTVPRNIPSLADLVANAVAATSSSISNDHSPTSNKSPTRPVGSIKRSQSHMDGRTIQTGKINSIHYRDRFYSQVKEEEARKLGLHVSLDEELLNIGKPSSSSNCKINDNLQCEIINKLNQLTNLWDTISAILVLSEQQNQFSSGSAINETIHMSFGNSVHDEAYNSKKISVNFYQKVLDNSMLLLDIEPINVSSKLGQSYSQRDRNLSSKINETNRLLSPNNEEELLNQNKKSRKSFDSYFIIPNSSRYIPESEIDISRSTKHKFNSPTKIYANFWPLHNLQKSYNVTNNVTSDDINEYINASLGCDDSSIYMKCDCWSCLPLLRESEHRTKVHFSSGNLTETSVPNSSVGTACASTGFKQHLFKLNKTANSSWEHTVITSSDSNSASIRPQIGSFSYSKSGTIINQLLQSLMSLLVNIVASSSSGMEIFDRSMTGSNLYKKNCSTRGILEMRFCLCYSLITELRLALEISLRTLTMEQYSYQTYFWLMENVKHNSSIQIVVWCLYNLLQEEKSLIKSNKHTIKLIEEKRLKIYSQQLWTVGSSVFYKILDSIIHNSNLNNLSVSEIKLLEMIVKLPSLLLFPEEPEVSFSQSLMNFEKSQIFSCLSELLNHLDGQKFCSNKTIPNYDNAIKIHSSMDITGLFSCQVTSNQECAGALFDNKTDIFWESTGSNSDLYPCILLKLNQKSTSNITSDHIIVSIYLDRTRDIINGQVTATARILKTATYHQILIEPDHIGWISFHLKNPNEIEHGINIGFNIIPDEDIHASAANGMVNDKVRVRCIKVYDASERVNTIIYTEEDKMRLRYDVLKEETLKSFIEMTNHIFYNCFTTSYQNKIEKKELQGNVDIETKSLHDFLVNILFDTGFKSEIISSRLSSLQRRVLSHIITQINFEVTKMLFDRQDGSIHVDNEIDCKSDLLLKRYDPSRCSCCFQLLNQVLALSGAQAGLRYLIHQAQLIRDLIILLYVGSNTIRQQVMFAITRIFSAVSPRSLEDILVGVLQQPEMDNSSKMKIEKSYLPLNLLAMFAGKSLNIQIKSKGNVSPNAKGPFSDFFSRITNLPKFIQTAQCDVNAANKIFQLINQLSDENNHAAWYVYIQEWLRDIFESFMVINQTNDQINWDIPNLYFLIYLLPLFDNIKLSNFWNNLSSTARVLKSGDKKMCTNHDDDSTLATVICYTCQPLLSIVDPSDLSLSSRLVFLCGECDMYLHLSKLTKYHIRDNLPTQVNISKENTVPCDCIINNQENCVRLKSNKFVVTVDTSTLKILINLLQNSSIKTEILQNNIESSVGKTVDQEERCRFCNEICNISDKKYACSSVDCQVKLSVACPDKVQPCGHWCLGVVIQNHNGSKEKKICPPICIAPTCSSQSILSKFGIKQDGDDVCMICFTDTLFEGPIIMLDNCRHLLHYHCARRQIQAGWPGYRVTFNFRKCPFCKQKMEHPALQDLLEPYDILEKEVKRKALLRLEHEGLIDSPEMKTVEGSLKDQPEEFALNKYCYYLCYKCKNSYYGGEARCEPDLLINPQVNNERRLSSPIQDPATELCCAACSDVAQAKICPKHSTDFLEYKCRYCCSVAVFFCFGTTHFCQRCHDNLDSVLKATWLPQCPAGPALQHLSGTECPLHVNHPPTGEEFALGCALCRKLDTF